MRIVLLAVAVSTLVAGAACAENGRSGSLSTSWISSASSRSFSFADTDSEAYPDLMARSGQCLALDETVLPPTGSKGVVQTAHEARAVPDAADDPEAALARQERYATPSEALMTLPVDLRACLVLRELEELSCKEIAQVTGASVGTAVARLWRARQSLATAQAERDCQR